MDKKVGKKEIILLIIVFAVIVLIWAGYSLMSRSAGSIVRITVDGEVYGEYSLEKDREIPIEIDGVVTNTLVISGKKADMIEANCPDQICVNMKAISAENETIVCLPNKIVVEVIESDEEPELDVTVQ